jgi:glucose/arabinose dehydrogenase
MDFNKNKLITFSSGHRNIQGLIVYDEIILSTEHGPRGGDEVNKIIYGKNYGWPTASYGEPYGIKLKQPKYFKEHHKYGYEEPLFVFSKAIGISEIINLPNKFSNFWSNNFIISSLWGQSLFRIKFDTDFRKVILSEKIYIGQRIRDIKYHEKMNAILLALEETGEIGIITKNIK